jgi:hypothetical protein
LPQAGEPQTPAVKPPPIDSIPTEPEGPPPAVEKPETPEWKLEMTRRLIKVMERRQERLESRLREAEREGETERARKTRLLLARTKKRIQKLNQDAASYEQQINETQDQK